MPDTSNNGVSSPNFSTDTTGIRLARVETELHRLGGDLSEIREDVREIREDLRGQHSEVIALLSTQAAGKEKCMGLAGQMMTYLLQPSWGLLSLLALLLLAAGLVSVTDVTALIPGQ